MSTDREMAHMRARRRLLPLSQTGPAILIALLAYFILVGGTPADEFGGWVRALNGAIAALLIVLWARALPTDNDSTDRWMVWALLLFLLTCVASIFIRQSFDAAIQATATVAAFYLARRKLAAEGRAAVELALGLLGLGISLIVVLLWGRIWLDWLQVSGGAAPPFTLSLPTGPFGNKHDVALLVSLLTPALWSAAFQHRRTVSIVGTALAGVIVAVDASRNVELAIVLASVVMVLGTRWRPSARQLRFVAGLGVAAGVVVVVIMVAWPSALTRVAYFGTVLGRLGLWGDAIGAWLTHPLTGVGPGGFPFSYMLTDHFAYNGFDPRHPDNAAVQLLVEGGIVGVAGGIACVVGLAKAATRRYRVQPQASWALLVFAFACFGANPTDFVFLLAPAVAWASILLPPDFGAGARSTIAPRLGWSRTRVVPRVLAAVVSAAVVVTGVASITYEIGRGAYLGGDVKTATLALDVAAELDPSLAIYQREGASLAFAGGDLQRAATGYRRAIAMAPYDPVAWRGLALALFADTDTTAAISAARKAVSLMYWSVENQLALAAVSADPNPNASRNALRVALNLAPQLAILSWEHTVLQSVDQADAVRRAVSAQPLGDARWIGTGQVILALIADRPGVAEAAATQVNPSQAGSTKALAAVGSCEFEEAARLIDAAVQTEWEQTSFWLSWPLVAKALGYNERESVALAVRYLRLPGGSVPVLTSAIAANTNDSWRFRRRSLGVLADGAMLPAASAALRILVTDPASAMAFYGSGWPPDCPRAFDH